MNQFITELHIVWLSVKTSVFIMEKYVHPIGHKAHILFKINVSKEVIQNTKLIYKYVEHF